MRQAAVDVCSKKVTLAYARLDSSIQVEDIIIASRPPIALFYLGRVNGWLREKQLGESAFTSFDSPTDEYYGIPLIDRLGELRELRDSPRRVWVITDAKEKAKAYFSPAMLELLEREFITHQADEYLTVYVNNPPALIGGLRAPKE